MVRRKYAGDACEKASHRASKIHVGIGARRGERGGSKLIVCSLSSWGMTPLGRETAAKNENSDATKWAVEWD